MITGDIETTEKVEYEDLLKNYYEKMEIIEKQDKEIERLKEDNEYLNKVNIELSTEKNRLNNIINELEEELDRGYLTLFEHELVPGRELITNIKNYLQELKGSE